jgi:LysM domain
MGKTERQRTLHGRPSMSMASMLKKGGLFMALLLVALALPGWSQEKAQQSSESASDASQGEQNKGNDSGEEAPKPVKSPAAAQASSAPPVNTPIESSTPPTGLHKVGDHWTPYEPPDPESFPEGAKIHVIVSGDTLWDLANTQFQDPYLWPQIWNENRYVLDSHWIYPGDPLLLPPSPTVVSEIVPATAQSAPPLPPAPKSEPAQTGETAPPSVDSENPKQIAEAEAMTQEEATPSEGYGMAGNGMVPVADHSDVYCTGEIRHDYKKTDLYIANEEQEGKAGLTQGDLVYLNAGKQGDRVHAGDTFQVVVKEEEVFHPVTDKWLGTYVRRAGKVKVLAVQENTAIAEITEACGNRIEVGYELEPYQEIPVPDMKEVPFDKLDVEPNGNANGYIVHVQDSRNQAFTGNVVDVDLGSQDGLRPGDVLQVYLKNSAPPEQEVKYRYKWKNRRYESQDLRNEDRSLLYPRKPVGSLVVLTTREKTSTAKIVNAIREIEVGNMVEIR